VDFLHGVGVAHPGLRCHVQLNVISRLTVHLELSPSNFLMGYIDGPAAEVIKLFPDLGEAEMLKLSLQQQPPDRVILPLLLCQFSTGQFSCD
jgi:hypothetical protein